MDHTELSGLFEIALDWTTNENISAPGGTDDPIESGVQVQLGLTLEYLIPLEAAIVDHADKVPTGN